MKKARVFIIVLFLLAIVTVPVLSSCSSDLKPSPDDMGISIWDIPGNNGGTNGSVPIDTSSSDKEPQKTDKPVPVHAKSFGDVYEFYYDQLDRKEKALYDSMLDCAEDGTEVALIPDFDFDNEDDVNSIIKGAEAFFNDHPEYFAYSIQNLATGTYDGVSALALYKYEYWEYSTSFDRYERELEKRVDQIVKETEKKCSNDYEKALYVHDYLVTHAAYDHEACDEILNNPANYNPVHDQVFTAYGCIVNGDCVCAGYAAAYKVILDRLGIPCVYVTGWGDPTISDVGHAWNRIILDGESYYVDITWDDGAEVYDDDGKQIYPESVLYNYFNITTEDLVKTHLVDEEYFKQPECEADIYNYYKYNGYQIDKYDFNRFVEIAEAQEGAAAVNIRFTKPSDAEKAEKDFINGGYERIRWLRRYDFGYVFDGTSGCVAIVYK